MPTRNRFFSKNFCLLRTVDKFTSDLKDNKSIRSHKTVEIKVFLNVYLEKEIEIQEMCENENIVSHNITRP